MLGERPRPTAVRRAGRARGLGQAAQLPVLHDGARGPGRGVVAPPRRTPTPSWSPSTTRRWRCSNCFAAQADRPARPEIAAVFMVNGGLFADAHTHPWQGTPLLRTPIGALAARQAQRSPEAVRRGDAGGPLVLPRATAPARSELAELRSAVTRRDGAAFLHRRRRVRHRNIAGTPNAGISPLSPVTLADTVAVYVGGSEEDPYEHRQVDAASRLACPRADVLTFPGGHLTTSEHPDLLADGHPRDRLASWCRRPPDLRRSTR